MPAAAQRGAREPAAPRLKVTEIFLSLQGEGRHTGRPTVFVRLTGCPLRCSWCDTAYAFSGGRWMSQEEVLAAVLAHGEPRVCVTGGEPLAQKACLPLLQRLCDAGLAVSLETSGALDVSAVDARVERVMDLKAPGSGEVMRNHWPNLGLLNAQDQIKFVLASREDYDWARQQIAAHALADRCELLFSPVQSVLDPAQLADWMLQDRVPARFQIQLHKVLWGDVRGR
jgi:7-carboxy-7-deazaguanine synthase